MGHVDAERGAVFQHVFEIAQILLGVAEVVRRAPGVEPSRIEFTAHERAGGKHFAEFLESVSRILAEIDHLEKIVAEAVFQGANRIAGEERNVETAVDHRLAQLAEVIRILAEEAVFVLHLRHHDRAAAGDLHRPEHAADFLIPSGGGIEEIRILGAQLDVRVFQKPPRQSAAIPLGAGVGTRPEHDPQAFFLGDFAKLPHVRLAGPIVGAFFEFMHVPEKIGAHRVHPHRVHRLQPVPPVFAGHAGEVDFPAADDDRFAIEHEVLFSDGKRVARSRCGLCRREVACEREAAKGDE